MNLKERAELQNQQKISDYQRMQQLEAENQRLKIQVKALSQNLKAEEDERLKIFRQREKLSVKNKELTSKNKTLKVYILSFLILSVVLLIINIK